MKCWNFQFDCPIENRCDDTNRCIVQELRGAGWLALPTWTPDDPLPPEQTAAIVESARRWNAARTACLEAQVMTDDAYEALQTAEALLISTIEAATERRGDTAETEP